MAVICGVDIVYIPKIRKMIGDDALLKKFFHHKELSPDVQHLAGIIAIKEAFFKALGMVPKFDAIEIIYEASGRPKIKPAPEFKSYKSCDVSISHDKDYAIALVVMEK